MENVNLNHWIYSIAVEMIENMAKNIEKYKDAINSANVDVSASIINDGSSSNPYRLLITANETGAVNDINYEID